ncbi:nitronate monooxygenase [Rhodococcus sp. D2-41]|uniref:Nitronate monooxygenase n=1 Tax=Speluncibacter jeojiensis TaxID=2710754 RepID=A0A9X4RHD7_9ACTN|nr:nitronate monooxygenase [Rhodococcus sp. D2-41]MDG3011685.1 nitronate monooxygenase [Rhodococcus sp. D2-41]MDG3014961.1 nitronate monooxygenase [Corynebacteriales bacterium D3-21]
MSGLPERIARRLTVPLIAAPMLRVSGLDLTLAACRAGVIGTFPTANARTTERLEDWLTRLDAEIADSSSTFAPYCPNLIIRQPRLQEHLDCLTRHRVEMVITSVGSPAAVITPLHDNGTLVFADVGTLAHAERAAAAGADGLVLLTAGAGGQTGWQNPFAFVRAVREFFDGPLVVAGGISDGHALWAARVAGFDLGYMGTRFIAAQESLAADGYRSALCASTLDDVVLTRAFTGLRSSILAPSIRANGLDPERLDETITPADSTQLYGDKASGPRRWHDIWSAGHSVSGVKRVEPASGIVAQTATEYEQARQHTLAMLTDDPKGRLR